MSDREIILKITTNNMRGIFIEDADDNVLAALEAPEEDEQSIRGFVQNLARDIQAAYLQLDEQH